MTTADVRTGTLEVPGAQLYYEVRGAGQPLLLICGGVYDAALMADLADRLADRYTVISYDRRGNSRSVLIEPGPQQIGVHADDAHRLLSAVAGAEPAFVFGNSSGAVIGLELVARHPAQVRVLVAHEPPIWEFLPDHERLTTATDAVSPTYWADGSAAADAVLAAALEMSDSEQEPFAAGEPGPDVLAMFGRMAANHEFFLGYEVTPFNGHRTDLDALRAAPTRIVMAAGADSVGEPPHRAALALADQLSAEAVLLPGGHGGFASAGADFGPALGRILEP